MINYIQKILIEGKYKEPISNSTRLIEKQNGMEINLVGFRKEGLKIDIDSGKRDSFFPSIINKNEKRYRKICDYLILLPNSSGADVYFIEMKETIGSTKGSELEGACNQILYTVPFLDYLTSMIKIHYSKKPIINKHFVVIAEGKSKRRAKQETKYTKRKYQHKGKNFTLIYSPKGTPLSIQYLK